MTIINLKCEIDLYILVFCHVCIQFIYYTVEFDIKRSDIMKYLI